MQCPNCRTVENGNWLYANGSRSAHDVSMDEWAHDEDLYDVSYSEMVCDCVNHTLNYLCLLKRLDFLLVFVLATCLFLLNFPIFQCVLLMLDMIPHANMQMVELTILFFWCTCYAT